MHASIFVEKSSRLFHAFTLLTQFKPISKSLYIYIYDPGYQNVLTYMDEYLMKPTNIDEKITYYRLAKSRDFLKIALQCKFYCAD